MKDINLCEYYDPNAAYIDYEPPKSVFERIYWFLWGMWCGLTQRAEDLRHALSGKRVPDENDIPF